MLRRSDLYCLPRMSPRSDQGSDWLRIEQAGQLTARRLASRDDSGRVDHGTEGSRTAMQVRSWMAALVLVAGTGSWQVRRCERPERRLKIRARRGARQTGDEVAETAKASRRKPGSLADGHSVELNLMIAGLGHDGLRRRGQAGQPQLPLPARRPARRLRRSSQACSSGMSSSAAPTGTARSRSRSASRARIPNRLTAASGSPRDRRRRHHR